MIRVVAAAGALAAGALGWLALRTAPNASELPAVDFPAPPPAAVARQLPDGLHRWVYHRERAAGVDERLLALLDWWEDYGPFAIVVPEHGGLRARREQTDLFARGVSYAATLGDSAHGHAGGLDLAPFSRGVDGLFAPDYSDTAGFNAIGEAAQALGLEWGGAWTGTLRDYPHVQVPDWRSLPVTERVS